MATCNWPILLEQVETAITDSRMTQASRTGQNWHTLHQLHYEEDLNVAGTIAVEHAVRLKGRGAHA